MTDSNPANQSSSEPKTETKVVYSSDNLPLNIRLDWCKACNICIAMCPKQVFEPDRDGKPVQARPESCTQCTICWVHCPDFAITSRFK